MHSLTLSRARLGGIAIALQFCLAGCAVVGPQYEPPEIDFPTRWHESTTDFSSGQQAELQNWWRSFDDPLLDHLVTLALSQNQDIGIAQARLRQARAARLQTAAALGPTVTVGASGQTLRASNRLEGSTGGRSRIWSTGLDASWEIDLFGGTTRAIESADANVQAVVADRRAVQVSLLAELATHYAELRTTQARLGIALDNLRNLRDTERLALQAQRQGLGSSTEVIQARAERETAEALPPVLEADVARLGHAIGVLAGGFPGDWQATLQDTSPVLPVAPKLPLSMPSDVIRQRPDLQADERRLAAATAEIGVAEAARFPRFSIPLGIASTASLLHDLFSGASLAWSIGSQASQTLYDGGKLRAGVTVAEASAETARLAYERDVRLALRDVEDALTALNSERRRQAPLTAAVESSQQALERATQLYRQGLIAYLPVLTAQRSANQSRDALALNRLSEVKGAISLYKALGAGWQDDGEDLAQR